MQWIEEEVVEETKEGSGVDPDKFAASLKSDDDATSGTSSLDSSSPNSSDSFNSDLSDKSSTAGEEGTEASEKVRFVPTVRLSLKKSLVLHSFDCQFLCMCCCP
jgi:hypothetical protein